MIDLVRMLRGKGGGSYLVSQGGRVTVQWHLVRQNVQIDLLTEANPVV